MKRRHRIGLIACIAALGALCAAGCGGSSSSSSSAQSTTAAAPTTSASGTVQPKTAGSPKPTPATLRAGQLCTSSRQRTYVAHGLSCVHGRLNKIKPSHTTSGGSTHTSTGGSSGGAGIGGSGTGSGGAPVGQ
jgi:hypothetical protein